MNSNVLSVAKIPTIKQDSPIYKMIMGVGLGGTIISNTKDLITKVVQTAIAKNSVYYYVTNYSETDFIAILKWLNKHEIKKHVKSYYLTDKNSNFDIAPGKYWFFLDQFTVCFVERKSDKKDYNLFDQLNIQIIGKYREYYNNELNKFIVKEHGTNNIVVYKTNNVWSFTEHPKRYFTGVFLNDNTGEQIQNNLDAWINSRNEYESHGLIYKTGFLFYGPPGTGKTTLAKVIATYLNLPLISIKDGDAINDVISCVSKSRVILFDDIDVLLEKINSDKSKITYDKLLSFIDGIDSPSNSVFIFATNHKEKLPESLIRAGRIDYKYYIGPASKDTAIRMGKYFGLSDEEIEPLVDSSTNEYFQSEMQMKIMEIKNSRCIKN